MRNELYMLQAAERAADLLLLRHRGVEGDLRVAGLIIIITTIRILRMIIIMITTTMKHNIL